MARSAGWAAGGGGRTGVRLVRFGASSALPVASAAGPGEVPEPLTLAALARRRDPFLHPHFEVPTVDVGGEGEAAESQTDQGVWLSFA